MPGRAVFGAIRSPVSCSAVRPLARFFVLVLSAALGLTLAAVLIAPAAQALLRSGAHTQGAHDIIALADLPETSVVYAGDGSVLDTFHAEVNRSAVSFNQVPTDVVNAVVDTEDDRFWQEGGVNIQATLRALVRNAGSGKVNQGGSTITQQLVKNTLLTSERSINRKVKEALLAMRLSGQLSKTDILERYLNTVYFGNGAYGIGAAAEAYFGVDVSKLDLVQGAFLAGMIRNPDGYDPLRFPKQSKARRDFVLDRLAARGHLATVTAEQLRHTPLPMATFQQVQPDNIDSYFVEEVKQRLLNDPRLGSTAQQRYNALFRGGLKIYTTLDPAMQAAAKQAVADNLPTDGGKWTTALVSVDSVTGAVRALIGGPGFTQSQYRIATQGVGRQPGSSFKPIVLAAALEQGYSPFAGVDGSGPCSFRTGYNTYYTAHNAEGSSGYTNLTNATAASINCAYARLGLDVGLPNVAGMAKRLGVTTPLTPLPSMSIGSEEVRPVDMAGVYATFADDGVHHTPYLVDKVVDRSGSVVLTGGDKGTQVLSPQIARQEVQILRAVTQYGTGTTAALADRPTAGKTGTTDIFSNAWFDGFTPQLTTVVWVGSPVGNISMYSVGGKSASGNYLYHRTVFGATYPSMIWRQFMAAALQGQPVLPFIPPDPLQLGRRTYIASPPGSYSSSYTPANSAPSGSSRSHTSTTVTNGSSLPTIPGGPETISPGGSPPASSPPGTSPPTPAAPAGAGSGP